MARREAATIAEALKYWSDGEIEHSASFPLSPGEVDECSLFIVQLRSECWVPVSVVLYARNEEHAKERIIRSIQEVAHKEYKHNHNDRAFRLLEEISNPSKNDRERLDFVFARFPDSHIAPIGWASNDTEV